MALFQLCFVVHADDRKAGYLHVLNFFGVFIGTTEFSQLAGPENGAMVAGNFGVSHREGIRFFGKSDIPPGDNTFFSAAIGHYAIGEHVDEGVSFIGDLFGIDSDSTYEIQVDLEYLQEDFSTSHHSGPNSLQSLIYNYTFTRYPSEDSDISFFIGFGVGGGQIDWYTVSDTSTPLTDNGILTQFKIGVGSKLTENFRINFGHRTVVFTLGQLGQKDAVSHRLFTGGEYKW